MKLNIKKINQSLQKIKKAEKEYKQICKETICSCKHEKIAESPYTSDNYGSTPEWRICLECRLAEEGWGIGFNTLINKFVTDISTKDLFNLVTFRLTENLKCKLLRKELTLEDLISSKNIGL